MRNQLIQYVDLLFAGAPEAEEIKQEILQNTLDRYDDLIAQGKQPQAAYSLAIAGIGDISELLHPKEPTPHSTPTDSVAPERKPLWKKIMLAIAIFLYIISAIPLIVLSEIGMTSIGFVGTLSIAAVATFFVILGSGSGNKPKAQDESTPKTPDENLRESIFKVVNVCGLCLYLLVSILTGAWYITWIIFPILAAVRGLIQAILDCKGAHKYED